MISPSITIELHDDKFKTLLSHRGCFPISFMDNAPYTDWKTNLYPNPSGDHYRVVDLLKTLGNLQRYNFIELVFGLPIETDNNEQGMLW